MRNRPQHVVVVGAGMVGLSTAWFLQREGVQVTVLDREGVAAGSSWGNAGWLAPALTLPLPEPSILTAGVRAALKPASPVYVPLTLDPRLLRFLVGFARHCTPARWGRAMSVFSLANREALDAFADLHDVAEPTRPADPFLTAFASEPDRDVLLGEFAQVAEHGGTVDAELLTGDEVRALEPALADGVTCGVLLRGQRFVNPGRFVHALADAVRRRGGDIVVGAAVEDVVDRGWGVEVQVAGDEPMAADAAVIANGTWIGSLAWRHGVRAVVQAGRGYSFTVQPEQMPRNPVYFPTQRVACTPLGDGFRVAGMMEFRRADAPLDPRRIHAIVDAVAPMLRGVDWEARTDEWVGSRPCTADGLPIVGRTRSPRVHVAGGHGMWGMALGPLTGRLLAAQIVRDETPALLRHLNPLR